MSRLLNIGAQKKTAAPKQGRDPFALNPERDWKILFFIAVMINVLIIAFHAFIFYNVTQGNLLRLTNNAIAPDVAVIDRDALTEKLEYFRKKEAELAEIITVPPEAPAVR
jgi:hypothetical protein